MKWNVDSLRDLWDNIKHTNIWFIGVPGKEEKKKVYVKIFQDIILKNFPNTEKKNSHPSPEPRESHTGEV